MSANDDSEPVGSAEEAAEEMVSTEAVGGLDEILPKPLQPLYRPIDALQEFRRTYGEMYITILEALVAITLTGGYVWWLFLFSTG